MRLPPPIVKKRKFICPSCSCNVDFDDPCAECPKNKWGRELCSRPNVSSEAKPQKTEIQIPSTTTMAKTFATAIKDEAKAIFKGDSRVAKEEIQKRMDICKQCEFFEPIFGRCKKCGCFLKVKTMFRTQACPIGKWGPEPTPEAEQS